MEECGFLKKCPFCFGNKPIFAVFLSFRSNKTKFNKTNEKKGGVVCQYRRMSSTIVYSKLQNEICKSLMQRESEGQQFLP